MELAAKDSTTGRCPACRTEYKEDEIDFTAPDPNECVARLFPTPRPHRWGRASDRSSQTLCGALRRKAHVLRIARAA